MIKRVKSGFVFLFLLTSLSLLLFFPSCVTRTAPVELILSGDAENLASVYIYMPKNVDIKGASSEEETLYANGAEVGNIHPGYSLGFLAPPGFITISTKGAYQEKLERVFYVNPGERLFVAMEKGLNMRDRGFLLYRKTEEEGVDGIGSTKFAPVQERENN